ncbi:MAG: BTAD domain-containing putative transcriptional regulator, partial [Pseudonocardia sp.]
AALALEEALALWRGPAYGEFADGFARGAATRLDALRTAARETRADALLQAGDPATAAALAADLSAAHPLRERPVEIAMRALAALGRTPDALEAFRRHRSLVGEELGLDPSPRLRELETRLLRADVAPPRAAPAPRRGTRLPTRPSPLVGRADELHDLTGALASRRLVTLVGPGGVGKTRTVLELAHRMASAGRAVWWVDLVPLEPQRLAEAVATALRIEIGAGTDLVEDLCLAVADTRGTLVLDNAEHVVDAVAHLVERLLDAAPELRVLVTSRERLALDGEAVKALSPLPLPTGPDRDNPAVRLFVERAPGLEPATLGDADLALVVRACRRLDGLPLAIELGAARAAALGLPALLERLDGRLDMLAGGRRTADRRHRTLRAVVEWSHDLLTEPEAHLYARLSVFPAGFSLDQVESVCADGLLPATGIADLLARLVEQSLVQRAGTRFVLLDVLRTHAAERLEAAGEAGELRRRHAADTAARLTRHSALLWTRDEPRAVAALNDLVADLHTAFRTALGEDRHLALRLAGDVHDYAYFRQRLDLLRWGTEVLDDAGADPERGPEVLTTAAAAEWSVGRLDAAGALAERGVVLAGGPDEPAALAPLKVRADLELFRGETDHAVRTYRLLAARWRAAGVPALGVLYESSVLQTLVMGGRTAEAAREVDALLAEAETVSNPTATAWAWCVTGLAVAAIDHARALRHFRTAAVHGEGVDSRLFVAIARTSEALTAGVDDPAAGLRMFPDVLEQWALLGNEMVQWWALGNLVVLLARAGADQEAAVLAGAVIAAQDSHPRFVIEGLRIGKALAAIQVRRGEQATQADLAAGAALGFAGAVAHARRALARPA